MHDFIKIMSYTILFGVILVIIFVRAPMASGGRSGASQASEIINSTAGGFAAIIRAATGLES
jgi:hypothetical protein